MLCEIIGPVKAIIAAVQPKLTLFCLFSYYLVFVFFCVVLYIHTLAQCQQTKLGKCRYLKKYFKVFCCKPLKIKFILEILSVQDFQQVNEKNLAKLCNRG